METVMKKARTVHECEGKPDYMVVDVTVPVSYCPFCGEELS